jgi:hypothetical protein
MEHTATSGSASAASSFAGLLAALTAPAQERPLAWKEDDLADDVTTLSYERALRAHARYKAVDPSDHALTQAVDSASKQTTASRAADLPPVAQAFDDQEVMRHDEMTPPAPGIKTAASNEAARRLPADLEKNLKCASITIRVSQEECAQLRRRATEAGLTVSAYMRSCTFEAESLRALVKDTLAQLRSEPQHPGQAPAKVTHAAQELEPRTRFSWLKRLWPRAHSHRIAQA